MKRILLGFSIALMSCLPVSAGNIFSRSSCCDDSVAGCCDTSGCHEDACADSCCDDGCDDGCGLDGCGLGDDGCGLGCGLHDCPLKLGNPFQGSDKCFNDFISPMTNPIYFEDPRTVSELRPIYVHHKLPRGVGGGNVNLWALQIRAALTDRLSFIATKDGFLTSNNPLIDDGWADVSAGLKYNLIRDPFKGRLLSAGAVFELPVGSTRAAQGNGGGEIVVFLSGGLRIGERGHFVAASGLRMPTDQAAESSSFYLSTHYDHRITKRSYLLTELNWYRWYQGGNVGLPGVPTVEGLDVFNFGAPDVAGNNIITWGFGMKFKPADNQEVGIAYEIPLSSRRDIIDNRLTLDYIYRF